MFLSFVTRYVTEWKVQNRITHVQTNIPLIHPLVGVGGMEGTNQNNPCTNQHYIDPSPGRGGGWMEMEGTKQNNSCTNQHSIDPSPGRGGGGWGWKVQIRTTHVQTNITLIHLLAGVGAEVGVHAKVRYKTE